MIDMVIFRIPDVDGEKRFVSVPVEKYKLGQNYEEFAVGAEDSFNSLGFDRIVFANKTEDGSIEVARYQIGNKQGRPTEVYKMFSDEARPLDPVVAYLLKEVI